MKQQPRTQNVSCHDTARTMSGSRAFFSAARFYAALRFYFCSFIHTPAPIRDDRPA